MPVTACPNCGNHYLDDGAPCPACTDARVINAQISAEQQFRVEHLKMLGRISDQLDRLIIVQTDLVRTVDSCMSGANKVNRRWFNTR